MMCVCLILSLKPFTERVCRICKLCIRLGNLYFILMTNIILSLLPTYNNYTFYSDLIFYNYISKYYVQ